MALGLTHEILASSKYHHTVEYFQFTVFSLAQFKPNMSNTGSMLAKTHRQPKTYPPVIFLSFPCNPCPNVVYHLPTIYLFNVRPWSAWFLLWIRWSAEGKYSASPFPSPTPVLCHRAALCIGGAQSEDRHCDLGMRSLAAASACGFGRHRIWINNNQGYNTNHVMVSFTVILYSTIFNIITNSMEICG